MDITTVITAILSALISGGGIAGVVFYRENKRARQLQNESTASAQWRELYEKSEAKVEVQSQKIETLYRANGRLRDQNNKLTTENVKLAIYKCNTISCASRTPPLGTIKTEQLCQGESETTTH